MKTKYGYHWDDKMADYDIELACLAHWIPPLDEHFINAIELLLSEEKIGSYGVRVNPWTRKRAAILARHMKGQERDGRYIAVWGPAAAGKTVDFGALSLIYWLADPFDTIVICASTSKLMLTRKIWGVMKSLYTGLGEPLGGLSDSDTCIRASSGAKCGGIYGVAVWSGDIDRSLANIFGTHARRVMIVVDEAQGTLKRIIDARVNLRSGTEEFLMVLIGNPTSISSPLGEYSEPSTGWTSLSMDVKEWKTKKGGYCYWFDGLDSPAYEKPSKYPGLISKQHIERTAEEYGTASAEYLVQARGFLPLFAASETLWSDDFIIRSGVNLESFDEPFTVLATYGGFDPSITSHGDLAAWQFLDVCRMDDGSYALRFHDADEFRPSMEKEEPATVQMAKAFLQRATELGVDARRLGVDATSVQAVIADLCDHILGNKRVFRFDFNQRASSYYYPDSDLPASERFANYATEIWFLLYEMAKRNRVRGVSHGTTNELMSRPVDMKKSKWQLEPKSSLRKRGVKSPNLADSALIALACAFRDYGTSLLGRARTNKLAAQQQKQRLTQKISLHVDPLDIKV